MMRKTLRKIQSIILYLLVYYNYILNVFIIWTALILLIYRGNTLSVSFYFQSLGFIEHSQIMTHAISRLEQFGGISVQIFAVFILMLATIEVVFLTAILRKRKWGVVGFMVCSLIWLPIQIRLVLRFFSVTKFSLFIINLFILGFLVNLIRNRNAFFK